jgi:addiction module HigA family antidote
METVANSLAPFSPTHPGEVIKEEIEYRGVSQRDLARRMGVPYMAVNEVLNGRRRVSPEFAILIEAALGIEADMFVRMQMRYDMQVARRDKRLIERFDEVRCAAL